MNKTTMFSLTLTLWGHHLFSVALAKDSEQDSKIQNSKLIIKMMKGISIFRHEVFGEIRTMTDERGEPFFVGRDVAKALGYAKPENALANHVDSEDKTTTLIQGTGSNYKSKTILINESGLYSLILSSKLEQAKAFKRWVTAEVLPQIRKTGGYIPTKDAEGRPLSNEEILERAQIIIGRTLRSLNAPSENCLTATAVARTWGMDVQSFNNLLEVMGIQYRKEGCWQLTDELRGRGLAEERYFFYYTLQGEPKSQVYLVWTPAGVQYLNQRLMATEMVSQKVVQLNLFINNQNQSLTI